MQSKIQNTFRYLFLAVMLLTLTNNVFSQYAVNGSAAQLSCNCYRLTPDQNGQSGSVWNLNQINLNTPFDFVFDVYFGTNNGGADGIGFVLQPISTTVGGGGGGMGFAGISPSWAVEMDTYQNGGDPGADHIAIIRNGNVNHGSPNTLAGPVQASATSGNIEDGAWHQLRVKWDPSFNEILIYFDGALRLQQNYDIIGNIFGNSPNVYWGFTAGTGGARNEHRFCVGLVPQISLGSQGSVCQGTPIQFTDNSISTIGINSWSWDFGDGNSSNQQNPTHTYSAPGTYTVTLSAFDINGCSAQTTQQVTILPAPNVNAGTDVPICENGSTVLNGSGATNYSWNPVTGLSNPAVAGPTANPNATTTYTLSGTDANGCSATDDVTVTVNPLPTADFSTNNECLGTPVQFTDNSSVGSGSITNYDWVFDDGNTDTQQNPSNNYTNAGSYDVSLTVTTDGGCTDMTNQTVEVYPAPTADFTFNDECLDAPIAFTNQSSVTGGTIAQYNWDFGDSNTSADPNPSHSYNAANTYDVTLDVETTDGCTASQTYQVTAFPMPVADFSAPDVCLGDPTDFTDNSSVSSGSVTNWDWDFDDSNTSSQQDPTNTYTNANQYDVELTVTTDNGCTSNVTNTISVSTNPIADFTFVETCETDQMDFTSTSTIAAGSISDWSWDFGDNSTSTDENPSHTYTSAGTYTVELTVSSGAGCSGVIQQEVESFPYPTASFTATTECFGNTTVFTDGSSVNNDVISNWAWDFDDTNTSSLQNPTHDYGQEGGYDVTLTVTTSNNCQADVTNAVTVHPTPIADFDNSPVCLNEPSEFTNQSSIPSGQIDSYSWDFGDSGSSSTANPSHTYSSDGFYDVSLAVTSDNGCSDDYMESIEVYPLPQVDFTSDMQDGCQPLTIQFSDMSTIAPGYVNADYQWDLGLATANSANPSQLYIDQGTHDISLTVTSANDCVSSITKSDYITIYPKPKAAFVFGPQPASVFHPEINFTDQSSGATSWQWSFGDLNNSTDQNPTHEYPDSGFYSVQQIVYNDFDCSDTILDIVEIEPGYAFYVPNAFTPNNDGVNDEFAPNGYGIEEVTMRIFNRWGEQIYVTNDLEKGWNGELNNMGLEMISDVYVYQINVIDILGEEHVYHGKVSLVR